MCSDRLTIALKNVYIINTNSMNIKTNHKPTLESMHADMTVIDVARKNADRQVDRQLFRFT